MIIKSSTALCNDYGMISDLAHEEAEQRKETLKLRGGCGRKPPFRSACLYTGGVQKTAGDDLSAWLTL